MKAHDVYEKGDFMKEKLRVSCLAVLAAIIFEFTACGGGGGGGSSRGIDLDDPVEYILGGIDKKAFSITKMPSAGGEVSIFTDNGLDKVNEGDIVTIYAIPYNTYDFVEWEVKKHGGENFFTSEKSKEAMTFFDMPAYNVQLTAKFKKRTQQQNSTNLTLSLMTLDRQIGGFKSVKPGEEQTVVVTIKNSGTISANVKKVELEKGSASAFKLEKAFTAVTLEAEDSKNNGNPTDSVSFNLIQKSQDVPKTYDDKIIVTYDYTGSGDKELTQSIACIVKKTYKVAISDVAGGKAEAVPADNVAYDEKVMITLTDVTDFYKFSGWEIDPSDVKLYSEDLSQKTGSPTTIFWMPSRSVTITPQFEVIPETDHAAYLDFLKIDCGSATYGNYQAKDKDAVIRIKNTGRGDATIKEFGVAITSVLKIEGTAATPVTPVTDYFVLVDNDKSHTIGGPSGTYLPTVTVRPGTGPSGMGIPAGEYTATIEVNYSDPEKDASFELYVSFTVIQAAGGTVSGDPQLSADNKSITINPNNAQTSTGQDIEYGISPDEQSIPPKWQTDLTFTDVLPGTTYYIFSRAKKNANYEAGKPSSQPAMITTDKTPGGDVGAIDGNSTKTNNSITINAVNPPANQDAEYGGQDVEYCIIQSDTLPDANTVSNAVWNDYPGQDEIVFDGLNPNKKYYVYARSKGNAYYEVGTPSQPAVITTDKNSGGNVGAFDAESAVVTHNSITIDAVTPPAGQEVEYYITSSSTPPDGNTVWTDKTGDPIEFSGLDPNKKYYIYARAKGNNFYEAGTPSEPAVITTDIKPGGEFVLGTQFGVASDITWSGDVDKVIEFKTGKNGAVSPITFKINATADITWYMDGKVVQTGSTNTYTVSSFSSIGTHTLRVVVVVNGKTFDKSVQINVVWQN